MTGAHPKGLPPPTGRGEILQLHPYARQPYKRVIAEMLLARQGGRCPRSNPDAACEGLGEMHHRDGNPNGWASENLELLCERHHRAETNRQRAEVRRSIEMCEKVPAESKPFPTSQAPSATLENEKSENYLARFAQAAPAFFEKYSGVVSVKGFTLAMISACRYTDVFGRVRQPSSVTIRRYIDDRMFDETLNPSGWFEFTTTLEGQNGIAWARKPPPAELTLMKDGEPYKPGGKIDP